MRQDLGARQWRFFAVRVIAPALLAMILLLLVVFAVIRPSFESNLLDRKREMIRELTNSAWSVIAEYHREAESGALSEEEAQRRAIARIEHMRYGLGGKDYFWITDMRPVMIMHPYRPDLNGKDLSDFKDQGGRKVFVEFARVVREQGAGNVRYEWQWKDDASRIVPKESYVRGFKPWGWVIGTGIYLEDVRSEIAALTSRLLSVSLGIVLVVFLLLFFIALQTYRIEMERRETLEALRTARDRYKTMVEASAQGSMLVLDGTIIH
ncbi:cache domain-containing protein, partial [bacterium]|nr:cache domain-containing protein [candidate division CSSED10-310 bacterium]